MIDTECCNSLTSGWFSADLCLMMRQKYIVNNILEEFYGDMQLMWFVKEMKIV